MRANVYVGSRIGAHLAGVPARISRAGRLLIPWVDRADAPRDLQVYTLRGLYERLAV